MKKVVLLVLLIPLSAYALDIIGRSDSFTRGDVLHSVYEGGWGYTTQPQQYVDSASVRDAINEQSLLISYEFMDAVERWDTISTTGGTYRYALNADCIEPRVVWVKKGDAIGDGAGITRINPEEIGYNTSYDDDPLPKFWSVWGSGTRYLLLDPVQDDADTATVLYRARSNSMSNDTTHSNLSMKYYDLLVLRTIIALMNSNSGSMVDRIYTQAVRKEAMLNALYESSRADPIRIKQDVK